jgi:ferritin-like metal-binding protein YciE
LIAYDTQTPVGPDNALPGDLTAFPVLSPKIQEALSENYTLCSIAGSPRPLLTWQPQQRLSDFTGGFPMQNTSLKELYVEELRDIYDAENQLVKALPEMAKAATSEELRSGFENHLEQTKEHVRRLEQVLNELGEKAKGKKCKGMQGLVSEGKEIIEEDFEDEVRDAALISAAQRVEHYEIAAYGTVRTYAEILGDQSAVSILEKTLEEEKNTDEQLTELAEGINVQAAVPDAEQGRSTKQKSKAARM